MSNKINLRKEQIQLIEKLAVMIEKGGLQPAMAKIIALLMVNDEPELTFDEIWETLGISKSAASQAINQLLKLIKLNTEQKSATAKDISAAVLTVGRKIQKRRLKGCRSLQMY